MAQRRQPLGTAHGLLGLPKVQVGVHELLRRAAVLFRLHAQVLRQSVGQVAGDNQTYQAQFQVDSDGFGRRHKAEKYQVRRAGQQSENHGAQETERGGCRHHRQQQCRPIPAVDAATIANQHETQSQLQHDPEEPAPGCRGGRHLRLQNLSDAKRHQRCDFECVAVFATDQREGKNHQPHQILGADELDPTAKKVDRHV